MKNLMRNAGFAAMAAFAISHGGDDARAEPSTVVFFGGGITENAVSGFVGAVWAPSGFGSSGVFFRLIATAGTFDFDSGAAPSGSADATTYGGSLSIGYRIKNADIVFAPFVGVDLYGRDISPTASDTGQLDDEVGVIVGARIDNSGVIRSGAGDILWSIDGNWASTNNRYFVEAEAGYDVGGAVIGPEVAALGDDEYNAFRVGGFGIVNLAPNVQLKLGAGYQFGSDDNGAGSSGGDSAYGELAVGIAF